VSHQGRLVVVWRSRRLLGNEHIEHMAAATNQPASLETGVMGFEKSSSRALSDNLQPARRT